MPSTWKKGMFRPLSLCLMWLSFFGSIIPTSSARQETNKPRPTKSTPTSQGKQARTRKPSGRTAAVARNVSGLREIEAHNLAEPGDILVIQGVAGCSSLGGISATVGKRQGEAGAVVDGGVRDIDHSRSIGYPIWSSSVSPITGKWRIETVAVNVPVVIAGISVRPGDLVVADEVGVCFVPLDRAAEVLAVARASARSDEERLARLAAGIPLPEFVAIPRRRDKPPDRGRG